MMTIVMVIVMMTKIKQETTGGDEEEELHNGLVGGGSPTVKAATGSARVKTHNKKPWNVAFEKLEDCHSEHGHCSARQRVDSSLYD